MSRSTILNPLEGVSLPDPDQVYSLLAKQISEAVPHREPGEVVEVVTVTKVAQLAEALGEIELETQISGASFLKVEVIDPEWAIATSGLIDVVNEQGDGLPQRLQPIEIEYPHESGYNWILCAVELTTDPAEANLVLTFEDIAVQKLREQWGPKLVRSGAQTRAQFAAQLLKEAGITPVIPSENVLQPVKSKEESELGEAVISTDIEQAEKNRRANKQPGISAGAGITIKGVPPTTQQLHDINTALSVAEQLHAGETATLAMLISGIAESGFDRYAENHEPTQTDMGIWQSDLIPGSEVERQATHFLQGGESFREGGAIKAAKEGMSVTEIPAYVEIAATDSSFYSPYLKEARAMLSHYGGVGVVASAGGSENTQSDVGVLHRGSKENPSETSFECLSRLAQEVDWYFFTRNMVGYYMDGYDLVRQEPALYVNVPKNEVRTRAGVVERGALIVPTTADFDNTTYYYQLSKRLKGRHPKASKLATPQSPSEIQVSLVCEETAYQAGDVFVFEGSGPLNGRWVVTDAVRLCMSEVYTTFTLQPPKQPLPEPKRTKQEEEEAGALGLVVPAASGGGGKQGPGAGGKQGGVGEGKQGVVEAAKKALSEKAKYQWAEVRPMPGSLFGATPRVMDCSAFATLCYKAAGEPDPNDLKYNGEGWTGTLWAHGTDTNKPAPGDLCFYGSEDDKIVGTPLHVTVYIGGGQVISMGEAGDPSQGAAGVMGPTGESGHPEIMGYRTY